LFGHFNRNVSEMYLDKKVQVKSQEYQENENLLKREEGVKRSERLTMKCSYVWNKRGYK